LGLSISGGALAFDVFLSHNSKDKLAVRQIADALENRRIRVWLDERELIPGRPWIPELERIIGIALSLQPWRQQRQARSLPLKG
jgi:TIR domain